MSLWDGRKGELDQLLEINERDQQFFEGMIKRESWLIERAKKAEVHLAEYRAKMEQLRGEHKTLMDEFNKEGESNVEAI